VREGSSQTDKGKTSREHKIYQPNADTYVIAGGKYTTFRVMGQPITQKICHHFGKSFNPDKSLSTLRRPSQVLPFSWHLPTKEELTFILQNELPKTFRDLILRRLSIVSRKDWELKTSIDFDQYFLSHFELLSQYLHIKKEDIQNFN
jgi:glycerol-3-phosphate dehydrogenase